MRTLLIGTLVIALCFGWYVDHQIKSNKIAQMERERNLVIDLAGVLPRARDVIDNELAAQKEPGQSRFIIRRAVVEHLLEIWNHNRSFERIDSQPTLGTETQISFARRQVRELLAALKVNTSEAFVTEALQFVKHEDWGFLLKPDHPLYNSLTTFLDDCLRIKVDANGG